MLTVNKRDETELMCDVLSSPILTSTYTTKLMIYGHDV